MCGIAGIFGGPPVDAAIIGKMIRTLAHRGPDDEGVWVDAGAGIGFGHRRLSIVDLSPAGHQPMHSPAGRFVITFNGEIYNHLDLRAELLDRGHHVAWRGHSDIEMLLAGFEAWGIKPTLERSCGMFAFASVGQARASLDPRPRSAWREAALLRTTDGPGSPFMFASELKALQQHPAFDPEIDRGALALFLRYLNVPAPRSIYRGHLQTAPRHDPHPRRGRAPTRSIEHYWSGVEIARAGVADPVSLDASEAATTSSSESSSARSVAR